MSGVKRGAGARVGIAALNILWPGVGLLRTGNPRLAAAFMAAPLLALLAVVACYAVLPGLTFAGWAALMAMILIAFLGGILVSAILSWRRSSIRAGTTPWWSCWYAIVGAWAALIAATFILPAPQAAYRNFYVPSESMSPTFAVNDRFVARVNDIGALRRGDIVLVRVEDDFVYVARVAALAGDRIGLAGGVVHLNGVPVPQQLVAAAEDVEVRGMRERVRRLAERFPGERRAHHIYDSQRSMQDDFSEVIVRPGHVFLLGDNRDRAADSRVPRSDAGLEQVRVEDVVGRPLFFSWWPGMEKSGLPIAE